jgi:hypothetical protein
VERARATELEQPLEHEIDPAIQDELLQHPGQWVALTRSKILATGPDPVAVLADARELGYEAPILYHVPEGSTSYFF